MSYLNLRKFDYSACTKIQFKLSFALLIIWKKYLTQRTFVSHHFEAQNIKNITQITNTQTKNFLENLPFRNSFGHSSCPSTLRTLLYRLFPFWRASPPPTTPSPLTTTTTQHTQKMRQFTRASKCLLRVRLQVNVPPEKNILGTENWPQYFRWTTHANDENCLWRWQNWNKIVASLRAILLERLWTFYGRIKEE